MHELALAARKWQKWGKGKRLLGAAISSQKRAEKKGGDGLPEAACNPDLGITERYRTVQYGTEGACNLHKSHGGML